MDTKTGKLIMIEDAQALAQLARETGSDASRFKEVARTLTVREIKRMRINKYAPCGCGSGKKFKFCCYNP
jgi:uncharacterized protein YchJ